MHKRADRLTAFHVDLAISLADVHGVAAGARELCQLGLPIELAHRVLLTPHVRRGRARPAPGGELQIPLQDAGTAPVPGR